MQLATEQITCFAGKAYLWLTKFSDLERDDLHFNSVLSVKELQRSREFTNPQDAQRYIAAHGLLRYLLSRYAPVLPQAWEFETTSYGKPCLCAHEGQSDLSFSLSYTHEYLACAISREPVIGIDIEKIRSTENLKNQIKRYCSHKEQQVLKSLTVLQTQRYFFKLWTLKEAFVKAQGTGLVYPIRSISFDLSNESSIRARLKDELIKKNRKWDFELHTLDDSHFVSLAIQTKREQSPALLKCFSELIGTKGC